jgi:hypothetical protein
MATPAPSAESSVFSLSIRPLRTADAPPLPAAPVKGPFADNMPRAGKGRANGTPLPPDYRGTVREPNGSFVILILYHRVWLWERQPAKVVKTN